MFLNSELFGHQRGQSNKGYKLVQHGDLILSTQNLHLGNANVNMRFEHGMVSPAYKTYRIVGCSSELLSHWVKSDKAKEFFFNATTVGASVCRRNVEWETLYNQIILLPQAEEQSTEEVVKRVLSSGEPINKRDIADLERVGFNLVSENPHYKFVYRGNERYWFTVSKTPSDRRSGMNNASDIIKRLTVYRSDKKK